jgi:hypothetical protein
MKMKNFFKTLLLCALFQCAYAYNPPIGIPDPGIWGSTHPLDSSAPSQPGSWTSDQAGYYYVDSTNPNSSDAGRGNLSVPRRTPPSTIPEAGLQPVLIVLAGGPYDNTYTLSNIRGTAANPVWIRGISNIAKTEFAPSSNKRAISISDCSYLYFENIYLNGANCTSNSGFNVFENSDHIVLRNSDIKNFFAPTTADAVYVGMSSGWTSGEVNNYHVFYNLNFSLIGMHNWPPTVPEGEGERIAIKLEYGVDHIWILNSSFEDIGEDGVHILNYHNQYARGSNGGKPQYIYIGNNTFYRCGEQGIDVKESDDVVISQNTIHYVRVPQEMGWGWGLSGGEAIQLNDEGYDYAGGDQSAGNSWVLFNKIYDVTTGVSSMSGRPSYIIGNLIYGMVDANVGSYGIIVDKPDYSVPTAVAHVVNNTIVNPIDYGIRMNSAYDCYSANNIIYELVSTTTWHERTNNIGHTKDVRNELYYDTTAVRTLGFSCVDCKSGFDPLFVNLPAENYSLSVNSPAKDAGAVSSAYDIFYSLYSIDIKKDILGITRPQGAGWDIGAYEYVSNTQQQVVNLAPGWNWISFNVLPADLSLNSIFVGILTTIEQVKAQTQSAIRSNNAWKGDLADMAGIGQYKMYKVKVSAACTLTVTGTAIAPVTPIALQTGWNWVAYLPTTAMPIATTLDSIKGQVLEIKSLTQSATYNGTSWSGTLTQLEPGKGYAIRVSGAINLIYPEG